MENPVETPVEKVPGRKTRTYVKTHSVKKLRREGFGPHHIAELLNISLTTVYNHLRKTRKSRVNTTNLHQQTPLMEVKPVYEPVAEEITAEEAATPKNNFSTGRKYINTEEVVAFRNQGKTYNEIADKFNISHKTIAYHLGKAHATRPYTHYATHSDDIVNTEVAETIVNSMFEAELFGTLITLDRVPRSIQCIGNRIVIK